LAGYEGELLLPGKVTELVVMITPLALVPRFMKKLFVPPVENGGHGPVALPLLAQATVMGPPVVAFVFRVIVNTPGVPYPRLIAGLLV
jgi:hypothetical protein